jgi:hypothetical protein
MLLDEKMGVLMASAGGAVKTLLAIVKAAKAPVAAFLRSTTGFLGASVATHVYRNEQLTVRNKVKAMGDDFLRHRKENRMVRSLLQKRTRRESVDAANGKEDYDKDSWGLHCSSYDS